MSEMTLAPVYRGVHRPDKRDSILLLWLDVLIITVQKIIAQKRIDRRRKQKNAAEKLEIRQRHVKPSTVALETRYETHMEAQYDGTLPFRIWDTEQGMWVGGLYETRDQAVIARAELLTQTVPASEADRVSSLTNLARYLTRLAGPTESGVLSGSGGLADMFTTFDRSITMTLTPALADRIAALIKKELPDGSA